MDENIYVADQIPPGSPSAPRKERRGLTLLLSVLLAAGLILYAVCLFKNISYPLMWADESMTAVGAERVLAYGYPKVHDGRNIFYDLRHTDLTLGIDKNTDAYIGGAGWGHYYFAAPFALLARLTSDIYLKTAILRVPFALAGFAGLLLLLWTGTRSLATRQSRLALAVLFVVLELPCVTLMLHMREVRYYSLQLLLTSVALSLFAAWHFRSSISYRTYAVSLFCLVPLLFLTFSPASVAICITLFLYLAGEWVLSSVREGRTNRSARLPDMRSLFRALSPLFASLVLVAPMVWFFRTLYMSRKLEEFYNYSFTTYLEHLGVVWGYFERYEIIIFAIAAKLILAPFWRKVRSDAGLHPALKLSLLLSIYFVAQTLLIGKIPNELFSRYFITLQPVLVLSFALDLSILARLALGTNGRLRLAGTAVVALLAIGSTAWVFSYNRHLIKGHFYEISHRYQGVLDFVIPYIQKRFEHPDQLVIAANYEETSYIYYLDCRVIFGFLELNLKQDLLTRPDCMIFRSFWYRFTDKSIYDFNLRRDAYEMVNFPVFDYGFNNFPETVHWTPRWGWERIMHSFKTDLVDDPIKQATLFVRRNDAAPVPSGQGTTRGTPASPQLRQE
jgi:hypothetical protein